VLLTLLGVVFAAFLFWKSRGVTGVALKTYIFWCALYFTCSSISSLLGAFDHGVAIGTRYEAILDKCHSSFVGLACILFVCTGMLIVGGEAFVWQFLYVPLAAFCIFETAILIHYDYFYFIIYGLGMFFGGFALNAVAFKSGMPTHLVMIGAGFVFLGGLLHAFKAKWRALNHNDFYHLSICLSHVALFLGALDVSRYLAVHAGK
jgi:hypothetical protein